MKILLITNPGIEDISQLEVKESLGKDASKGKGFVMFETDDPKDIITACFKFQSISKAMVLLDSFPYTESLLEELEGKFSKNLLKNYFEKACSFSVKTVKQDFDLDISSPEIVDVISTDIHKDFSWDSDYRNPDVQFLVYFSDNKCYLGIDLCQLDLDKRHYKIFQVQPPLKATVAYALARLSGFDGKKILLDPNCGSGLIAIEAALFQRDFPVNFFDKDKLKFPPVKQLSGVDSEKIIEKLKSKAKDHSSDCIFAYSNSFQHINATKKNAKIAGINDSITFSRQDLDWLELKFGESAVDCIACVPLQYSQHSNIKNIEKWYDELFKEAEFIMKKSGKIVLLSRKDDLIRKYAEKYNFKLNEERFVSQGKEDLFVLVYAL